MLDQEKNLDLLAKWNAGSTLFGTATPTSDRDYGGIFKNTFADIVMGRAKDTVSYSTGNAEGKNTKDDKDVSLKELRFFVREALGGQSAQIEALFIPKEHLLYSSDIYEFLVANRDKLIGDLRPILSYCQNQARVYTMKAESVKHIQDILEYLDGCNSNWLIEEIVQDLPSNDYAFVEKGEKEDYYRVGSKRYQMTADVHRLRTAMEKKLSDYGDRAKGIKEYDGKAYSHALRLVYQYKRLVNTGELIFPCPEAGFLRAVKMEAYKADFVKATLDEELHEALQLEPFIGKPDPQFWEDWLVETYKNG